MKEKKNNIMPYVITGVLCGIAGFLIAKEIFKDAPRQEKASEVAIDSVINEVLSVPDDEVELQMAIEAQDYERAAAIRDRIKKGAS